MKIGLLSYEYPPDTGFGGIGTYTWYQARALVQLGHQVEVIAGSLEPGVFRSEHEGVQVTRILDPGPYRSAIAGLRDGGQPWAANRLQTAAGAYRALAEVIEQTNLDVVEYPDCGGDGILVSTLQAVPTAVRFHSPAKLIMSSYGAEPDDIEVTSFFEQVAIDQADMRISPSAFLAAEVAQHLGVPPPVHVIRNGIDLDLFDREEGINVVDRFGLPAGDAVTILFSSRLERRKGVHLLPEICAGILARHRRAHVVIAGDDPTGATERTIRPAVDAVGAGDRLHHLGRLALDEVRALVKHVDIQIQPTLWENAPYACIEAMAAGRAVIASDSTGMPELIHHRENGLLARTDDASSFVDCLDQLIEDPLLRERLGAAARRTVEKDHDARATAEASVEVWRHGCSSG